MSSEILFRIQLVFGYVAWLLCFSVYIWPRLKAMDRFDTQRAITRIFRTFGADQGAMAWYGRTRARSRWNPARPYIWRLIALSRLM